MRRCTWAASNDPCCRPARMIGRLGQLAFISWTFCIVVVMIDSTSMGKGRIGADAGRWTVVTLPSVWSRLCQVWKRLDPLRLKRKSFTSLSIFSDWLNGIPRRRIVIIGAWRNHNDEWCHMWFCDCWNIWVEGWLPRFAYNIVEDLVVQHKQFTASERSVQYSIN